jgi:hypothetical protein
MTEPEALPAPPPEEPVLPTQAVTPPAGGGLRRRWTDRSDDIRGILAIVGLVGAFGLAFYGVIRGGSGDIPAWSAGLVAAIVTSYFVSKGSNGR